MLSPDNNCALSILCPSGAEICTVHWKEAVLPFLYKNHFDGENSFAGSIVIWELLSK